MNTPLILQDRQSRLYLKVPSKRFLDFKGNTCTRYTFRRCDEHGQPLIRLRLSKKHKLKLRRAGIPATKWVQQSPVSSIKEPASSN